MKTLTTIIALICTLFLMACSKQQEIFNGKDLSGWTPKGGTCTFEVIDGMLVGTCVPGSPSTYLSTEKNDFEDFIFTCDMKWEVDGNSGVMFRAQSKAEKDKEIVFGPQAEQLP